MPLTRPFPFNDHDSIVSESFAIYRPYDIDLPAIGQPPVTFSQGLGYWRGSTVGFFETETELKQIKGFLNLYADGRSFDVTIQIERRDWSNLFIGNNPGIITPTGQIAVGGQNYLNFAGASLARLQGEPSYLGLKREDYFTYRNQLFELPLDQLLNGDFRIPLYPNVLFDAIGGNIDGNNTYIRAKLDPESGLPSVVYNQDGQGFIEIAWVQHTQWGD